MSTFEEHQKKRQWRQWVALFLGGVAVVGVLLINHPSVQTQLHSASCHIGASFGQVVPHVPVGSPWQDARVLRATPPRGYAAGAAWITAATATECVPSDAQAHIEIDTLRVIGIDRDGGEEIVFEERFAAGEEGVLDGGLYVRYPTWFATDRHEDFVAPLAKGRLQLHLEEVSQKIVHLWTPRFVVMPDVRYVVEARVRVRGLARVQFGMDFWRNFTVENNGFDDFCRGTNNCEAHVGAWIGDTDGAFVTVRSPQE